MVGIYLAYQPSLTPVAPEQIRRLTKNAAEAEPGLSVVEYTPVPHLYVRHIYRPITHASGASVPSPNGRVEILLHGEVYDSPALARYLGWEHPETLSIEDGPRLIAAGIERDGIDFVERLNGSFLLLAWFPQDKKLCIASDRCALRPHYYTWENGVFLMAPQVEALSRARQQAPPPNPMGVVELLTFEHLLGNKTLCEGIDVFPPASILEPGKSLREYWDFCFDESPATVNRDALREELQTRLATAVHRQLPASVPLGVPLSGGLDSRCLAGVAAHSIKNLPVFTFGNSRSLESKLAHQVALALKADEHTVSPDTVSNWLAHFGLFCQATDGMVSVRHGHAGMLLDTLSSNCGVVLDGLTGGILFGGHMRSETLNKPLPTPAKCWMARPAFGRDELRSQLASDVLRNAMENVEDGFQQRLAKCKSNRWANARDYVDWRERQRRFILNGNLLLRQKVEVRTPFYDRDLLDFAVRLPEEARVNAMLYREALVGLAPELKDVPRTPYGDSVLYTGSEKATLLRTLRRPELILRKKQKIWRPVQAFVLKHLLPFLKRTSVVDYRAIFLKEPSLRAFLEKAYPAGNPWFASAAIGDLFTQARQSPGNVGDSATFRLCGLLTLALYRKQLGWE